MASPHAELATLIFFATIAATFVASYLGRRHSRRRALGSLSDQHLNRWVVGLSAGATANSGFVVTGAVGLGYSFGAHWLLLPLAWLAGDIVFWTLFPHRINKAARDARATTMTDIIASGLGNGATSVVVVKRLVSVITLLCLGGYVSAQWIAGEKFLAGAFGFSGITSLLSFAALIVLYTAIGGFRGSVYADSLQAVIRVIGTSIALAAVAWAAAGRGPAFWSEIHGAGPDFLSMAPNGLLSAALFVSGYAAAALGFGLGQPQIVTRYMAGSSPEETRAAWWVYIGFVQFTWIAMTLFGMALRGIMPGLSDPETGLSAFFRTEMGPVLTGIIVADIFATIAATTNGLLVAMVQTTRHDLFLQPADERARLWPVTAAIGAITMLISSQLSASVVDLALSSVSLMGAGLAPALVARVLGWRQSTASVCVSIIAGIATATVWKFVGYGAILNEAFFGILAGLAAGAIAYAVGDANAPAPTSMENP
jgi:Na+/proline symporter